jgi:hypothetical protein
MASQMLGVHLEPCGDTLRLYYPETKTWQLTPEERANRAEQEIPALIEENERLRRQLQYKKNNN